MNARVGHPGKRRLQLRQASATYYRKRADAWFLSGLTTRGTRRIYVIDRSELSGRHGCNRKAQYQRLTRAALAARGLTARGTVPIHLRALPPMETAWRQFRAPL